MKREEIHFVIDCEGNIQSTIQGVKGSACRNIALAVEKLGQVVKQERTEEFYERSDGHSTLLNLAQSKKDSSD